jgi:hypothetical protein
MSSIDRLVDQEEFPLTNDLLPGAAPHVGREADRHFVRQFGELLGAWPEMLEAARAVREECHGIAVPVTQEEMP